MALAELRPTPTDSPFQTTWETDFRGMNHYQSPSWYRYVGEGPDSSFGEDWLRFYHPDDRDYLQREWRKSLASEGAYPYDIEVRIRRHDGEYRWFRVQGAPVKSSDGRVVKWTGTCTDIHDEKLASLRTQEASWTHGDRIADRPSYVASAKRLLSRIPQSLRLGPLQRRLFLIVFVGLLPLVVLSFVTLHQNAQRQKRELLDSAGDTMLAVATAVDAELNISLAALDVLAMSPRLARGEFRAFYDEARELLRRRPGWATVALSDPSARQIINAYLPFGAPLPGRLDPLGAEEVARTGKPYIGNIFFSPVLKMYVFGVRIPIKQNEEVKYVLSAVMRPDSVWELLKQQRIPEQGVVAVFDRNYNVVARSLNHKEWLGKPAADRMLQLLRQGREYGWAATTTLEGRPVYSVFHRSAVTGWSVAVGIPASELDGPVHRSYIVLGGSIVLSMLLGLVAALFVARSITRPMRELERAAAAMGRGAPPTMRDTRLPEIRRAAFALAAAHTERARLLEREREARLLEKEARLLAENANKAKDEFLAMLGHELRNPLAAIKTAAQILDNQDRAPQRMTDEAKAIIRRQVDHLARLTDDLLDAGRVMMGKIYLDRKPLNLGASVQSAVEALRNTGSWSHYELTLALDEVWVNADATRIAQIVTNLLVNATKYTLPPGTIAVSVKREGDEAVLRVRDSGLGLEPDLLPRVFDLFVQGRRSLDRAQGGLGIGLTLVRRLTELHGGRVEAKSDGPGKGSEFIVRLPAMERPSEQPAAATPLTYVEPRNIVIVEDNRDLRASLRSMLEMEGHHVQEAADGAAGVEAILRDGVDVAIVDVGLPVLDGLAVARTVRDRATRKVRLIAITGYGNREDVKRGIDAGFDAYLVKPIETAKLLQAIART
ncbi:MAG: ATP-binding protein [Sulfurifustaceae bacterium]